MKLKAIYGRVSTDRQEASTAAQESRVVRYCEDREIEVPEDRRLYDTDTSGSIDIADRPKGRILMDLVNSGRLDTLVIADVDRLSRDTKHGLNFAARLLEMKVALHIVDLGGNSLDISTPAGEFFFTLLLAKSRFELAHLRMRTKNVLDDKRDKAFVTGEIPYGKTAVDAEGHPATMLDTLDENDRPVKVWPVGTRLAPDPEEQAHILNAAQLRLAGYTCGAIAHEFNMRQIPSKKGGIWRANSLEKMLTNLHTTAFLEEKGITLPA